MSKPNPDLMLERFSEIRAVASVQQITRLLDELSRDPNTKRFNRSRAVRAERWRQLASEADQQALSLGHVPAAPKRRAPRVLNVEAGEAASAAPATAT